MSPQINQNSEHSKKPSISESVDGLISKKKTERDNKSASVVQESAAGVQGEVADIMGGAEGMRETVSERVGESGEKGDIKGSSGVQGDDDDTNQVIAQIQDFHLPSEVVMVRKVRTAIKLQIKYEMKKALKLSKNLGGGNAQEFGKAIARIRELKSMLSSLFHSTFVYIKGMYQKYFDANGKRRSIQKVD